MSVPAPEGARTVRVRAEGLGFAYPELPLFEHLSFEIPNGLSLVCGGESRGKSTLMRLLAGALTPQAGMLHRWHTAVFEDGAVSPDNDTLSGRQWLQARRTERLNWDARDEADLSEAFGLIEHIDKPLYMLSTGSRRKVGLVAAAASGAQLTLLDTPYRALDMASRRVLSARLARAAGDPLRAWVVADYELPDELRELALATIIDLGD